MVTKTCRMCEEEKDIKDFGTFHKNKDGLNNFCKCCISIKSKKYREANKDKIITYRKSKSELTKEYNKQYYENNKVKVNNYNKEYYENNKVALNNQKKEYYKNNKHWLKIKQKEWSDNNRALINKSVKNHYKKYPHKKAWRGVLTNSLRRMNKLKEGHTIDLLGYSVIDLKTHLESLFTDGMSWDNYGEWHIDHIKPVVSFDSETPINIVNALSNLQPLWATTREINGVVYIGNLNKNLY